MAVGIFRLSLPDSSIRLATGEASEGPARLLPEGVSLDDLVATGRLDDVMDADARATEPVPDGARVLAPVGSQEVWAAGVTYLRSRDARVEEAVERTPYDRVYEAERPELFFKSAGWRVRGPGERIAIRADSYWDVPEPELTLVLDGSARVVGYTIGNDVSSRSIEGENPLYLPQAKTYDGSCSVGPCLVPAGSTAPPFSIVLEVVRDGDTAFRGETSTERMRRSFEELAGYLGRALSFPSGAILLTGTGIVPDPP
ncbi:MAG TPA: fumarylacetoacetate hydrolase family protein, partial [Actinomycetota bacterium]|nr:fumarylacetoacetate hydrolase family protein [Actinomycetota bacterium]